jgi:hypothetical protein
MVQSYGTGGSTYGVDVEPSSNGVAGEDSSLLGRDTARKRKVKEGHATLVSGIGNLANTIVGSGESLFDCSSHT